MKGFFSYDENQGFERHETAAAAKADAESALQMYRDDAGDGWPDDVNRVCWGLVLGAVSETARRERCPDTDCDGECDRDVHHCNDYDVQIEYAVLDTDSELAHLRADLTALRERLRWVPVGERLPEDGRDVCAWNGSLYSGWYAGQFYDYERRRISGVTHWRYIDAPDPLPAAPEVQAAPQKCPQCHGTGWINAEGDSCDKDDPQSCGCPECACICGGWMDDGGEHGNCMEVHNV